VPVAPEQRPTQVTAVYHPDTPLEPTPSLSLASWMTPARPESARS
jgi:hypothetical protein